MYSNLLNPVPNELKRRIRKYEDKGKEYIKKQWSIKFNQICLNEYLLPHYTIVLIRINNTVYFIQTNSNIIAFIT